MAATDSAVGTSSLSGAWLTTAQERAVIGYPDNPEWPGPVSENHADPGPADPGRSGPLNGPVPDIPYPGALPAPDVSGGVVTDQVAGLEHSAPIAAFDSNALAFGPPGAIADTHGNDTGGTQRKEAVPLPKSPGWWRRTLSGQTWNRQAQVTDNADWNISAPNARTDLDQYQGQDADGYHPFTIPYSERPLRANFAAEAHPITDAAGGYTPSGALSDMAGVGGQGNYAYTAPPDPSATVQPAAAAPASQPVLGMEYVSG